MLVKRAERFHDTHKAHLLQLPKYRTITYGKRSFKCSAAHIWNEFDNNYKQDLDLESFSVIINTWNAFTCGCSYCILYV